MGEKMSGCEYMRPYIAIILILIGNFSFAQYKQDTTISKRSLDSLQQQLASYKDRIHKNYFANLVEKNTISIDTLYSHKRDTVTILNYLRNKNIIRKQIFQLDSLCCKTNLEDFYYDSTNRLLYCEQWKLGCSSESEITGSMQNRCRYHYNNLGKEIGITVEFWNGGGHRVRKTFYTIDQTGKKILGNTIKLGEYSFWE